MVTDPVKNLLCIQLRIQGGSRSPETYRVGDDKMECGWSWGPMIWWSGRNSACHLTFLPEGAQLSPDPSSVMLAHRPVGKEA